MENTKVREHELFYPKRIAVYLVDKTYSYTNFYVKDSYNSDLYFVGINLVEKHGKVTCYPSEKMITYYEKEVPLSRWKKFLSKFNKKLKKTERVLLNQNLQATFKMVEQETQGMNLTTILYQDIHNICYIVAAFLGLDLVPYATLQKISKNTNIPLMEDKVCYKIFSSSDDIAIELLEKVNSSYYVVMNNDRTINFIE